MSTENERLLFDANETSKYLGLPKTTIYRLAKTKDFPCIHCGKRKMFPVKELEKWASRNIGKDVF